MRHQNPARHGGAKCKCAQDNHIKFRIGVHVGDIIIDDNDILATASILPRGSKDRGAGGSAFPTMLTGRFVARSKCPSRYGLANSKNIAEPMRVWRMRISGEAVSTSHQSVSFGPLQSRPFSDKPSIAVLPFQNMSGDPSRSISPMASPKTC